MKLNVVKSFLCKENFLTKFHSLLCIFWYRLFLYCQDFRFRNTCETQVYASHFDFAWITHYLHGWLENMLGYLCANPYLFQEANFELWEADYFQGHTSEHIFAPNEGYCVYYPSNLFRNTHGFENWEYHSDILHFWLGNNQSRDAFRPIAHERKYLTDYNAHWPEIANESDCLKH